SIRKRVRRSAMPRTSTTEAMNTKLKPAVAKEIVQKYHHKLVLFIPYLPSGRRIGQPARPAGQGTDEHARERPSEGAQPRVICGAVQKEKGHSPDGSREHGSVGSCSICARPVEAADYGG